MKKKTPDDSIFAGATLAGPSFACSRKCSRSRAAYMCGGGMLAGNTMFKRVFKVEPPRGGGI